MIIEIEDLTYINCHFCKEEAQIGDCMVITGRLACCHGGICNQCGDPLDGGDGVAGTCLCPGCYA